MRQGRSREATQTRHRVFVEAYIATTNATQAAITAGYSARTAYSSGQRLLKNPKVAEALQERQDELAKRHGLTAEDVIRELAAIVRVDPRKAFDKDGKLLPPSEWPDELARAIAAVDVVELKGAEGTLPTVIRKLKLWDKNAALTSAMKHLGLYAEDNKQQQGNLVHREPLSKMETGRSINFAVSQVINEIKKLRLSKLLPAPPKALAIKGEN